MSTDNEFLEGIPSIARAVGRSKSTIPRWIKDHGFPACKLPSGTWFTSRTLINNWILARRRTQTEAQHASESTKTRPKND